MSGLEASSPAADPQTVGPTQVAGGPGADTARMTQSQGGSGEGSSSGASQADKNAASAGPAAAAGGEPKLSAKELKAKKAAEKAARRAQVQAARAETGGAAATTGSSRPAPASSQGTGTGTGTQHSQHGQQRAQEQHRRTGSQSQSCRPHLPRRNSKTAPVKEKKKASNKEVGLFGHLYGPPRRTQLEGVSREVHPAVLALGFQFSSYTITGSSARCVAMLLAFKTAIASYTTPPTTSLARHLTSHYLSPQIDYLKSHRPISVSMGNSIRWLKDYIIQIDPDVPEHAAKASIADAIDTFIRERITVADTAIATLAAAKIRDGARIVTYGKSSIVERTLLRAAREGKKLSVACLDSRPLFEGRNLVKRLSREGIDCSYALLPAADHVLREADLVLLGAHAMMANGRLYSRVGTASVAMLAKNKDVPVIVCCESLKFTDRVALDSIVLNEVAPSEELIPAAKREKKDVQEEAKKIGGGSGGGGGGKVKDEADKKPETKGLEGWKDVPGLQLLNILYDVTPAEFVDMVITEYGSLPPSSVPVVHRISTERDVRA